MELSLPAPNKENPPPVKNGVTFLLTKNHRIFYYAKEFITAGDEKGRLPTQLIETSFDKGGLHKLLLEQNQWAVKEIESLTLKNKNNQLPDSTYKRLAMEATADTKAITVLIKTDDEATYRDAIDILDELKICHVGKRILGVEMMNSEYELLKEKIK